MKNLFCLLLLTGAILSSVRNPLVAQPEFQRHMIASPLTPRDVFTADVNGDGSIDLLTVSLGNGGDVVWWENNGSQSFEARLIARNFINPRSVRGGDIDNDGDIDVIAASWEGNRITWWENDGNEAFTAHDVVTGWAGPHTVELYDLDMDGDTDILCSQFDMSANNSEIAWWENDGNQNWTKHVVSERFQQSPFIMGADMDNDGDMDLIGCGELNGEICWWENDGNENWTEHIIDNDFPKAHTIIPRDFDKDGDLDILGHACASGLQAWYENTGSGTFRKNSMEDLAGAIWMDCSDFDLDGDYDMIATGMGEHNLVCYENDGKGGLSRVDLEGNLESGFALNIADIDGDGDDDVVAVGANSNTLAWWENKVSKSCFLNSPKWIDYDAENRLTLAVNEESGSIVRIEESGRQRCIRNGFPIFTALVCSGNRLWVASGVSLYKLNTDTGITESDYRLPAQFLQGLTKGPNGFLYASDPYSGLVFRTDPENGQTITLTSGLDFPQALKYDQSIQKLIVLDGESSTTIKCIDPETGLVTSELQTNILPGGDIIPDGIGNHYITSPDEGLVYAGTRNLTDPFFVWSDEINSPAGLVYFPDNKSLGVLSISLDSLFVISAGASGSHNGFGRQKAKIGIYPNPVRDSFYISGLEGTPLIRIFSLNGQLLRTFNDPQFSYDISSLPSGVYVLNMEVKGTKHRETFIKR